MNKKQTNKQTNNEVMIILIIVTIIIIIIIIIIIKVTVVAYYKKLLSSTFPAPNTSTSLQTKLAADAHLAEGQFLLEQQTLNKAKSLIYRTGTRRPIISKTEGQNLKPK
jgi:uncharacterized membrane protein YcgQ (UPF0703/DUF1980 family)